MSFTVRMCTFSVFMFKSVQGSKKSLYLTYVPENIYCGLFEESQFLPSYVGMWSTVCSFYTKCPVHTTTTNRYVLYSNHALQLWCKSSPQQWQQQLVHGHNIRPTLDAVNTQSQLPTQQNNDSKESTNHFLSIEVYPTSALAFLWAFHLILYHHDQQLAPERISS